MLRKLALLAVVAVAFADVRGVAPEKQHLYKPDSNGKWHCLLDPSIELLFSQINDNHCDCPDGSDEPGTNACEFTEESPKYFYCANDGYKPAYIENYKVNDGVCDYDVCCDGSDEWESGKCENKCKSVMRQYEEYAKTAAKRVADALVVKSALKQKAQDVKNSVSQKAHFLRDEIAGYEMQLGAIKQKLGGSAAPKKLNPLVDDLSKYYDDLSSKVALYVTLNEKELLYIEQLEQTLKELVDNYNPNLNDQAVKNAVKEYTDYVSSKVEETQDLFDLIDLSASYNSILEKAKENQPSFTKPKQTTHQILPTIGNMFRYYYSLILSPFGFMRKETAFDKAIAQAKYAYNQGKKAVDQGVDTAKGYAADGVDTAKAAYNDGMDTAKDAYDAAAKTAKNVYDHGAETAKSAVADGAKAAKNAYDEGSKVAKNAYDDSAKAAKNAYDDSANAAQYAYDESANAAQYVYDTGKAYVDDGLNSQIVADLAKYYEDVQKQVSSVTKKKSLYDETVAKLEKTLSDIKDNYNPNFNDQAVKNAVSKFGDYISNKAETTQDQAEDSVGSAFDNILQKVKANQPSIDTSAIVLPTLGNTIHYYYEQLIGSFKPAGEAVLLSVESAVDTAKDAVNSEVEKLTSFYEEMQKKLTSKKSEASIYDEDLSQQMGEDDILRAVKGEWVSNKIGDYTYKLGFMDAIYQDNTLVGRFTGIDGNTLLFANGSKCWNGPLRSAVVDMICGPENELISVSEPEKCQYRFVLTTPLVCSEVSEKDLAKLFKVDPSKL